MSLEQKTSDHDPLAPYVDVAGQVVKQIGTRAGTDGDPQHYGAVYAGLAATYLHPVVALRGIGPADIYVLDVLRAISLMVSGGMQAQRFRDIATAAIAGSVHVEAAVAAVHEALARQNKPETAADRLADDMAAGDAPAAPAAPEPAWHDDRPPMEDPALFDDTHEVEAPPLTDADKAFLDSLPAAHPFRKAPYPTEDANGVGPLPAPDVALAAAEEDDEARATDADLLRWVLDSAGDPWADLLEPAEPGQSAKRELRSDATPAMVQARFDRLHSILDDKAPPGVPVPVWVAAQRRTLPVVYGDRGAA